MQAAMVVKLVEWWVYPYPLGFYLAGNKVVKISKRLSLTLDAL